MRGKSLCNELAIKHSVKQITVQPNMSERKATSEHPTVCSV